MEENLNVQQPAAATQPEENGIPAEGRTFTQEEVNQIVRERLAREREKAEAKPNPENEREQSLKARENKMACKEYIAEKGYQIQLAEILDINDFDNFKETVEKLVYTFPSLSGKTPCFVRPTNGWTSHEKGNLQITNAFKPKI